MDKGSLYEFCQGVKTIALVGAGGKTSTLFSLAKQFTESGRRVLVYTTTHMMIPSVLHQTAQEAEKCWEMGKFAVIGSPDNRTGKIGPPQEQLRRELSRCAEVVLVEADGSRRLPVKAPRTQEPVLPEGTDLVLCVMGLSALGKPLEQCCFGLPEACTLLGVGPEACLTPELAAALLSDVQGGRKNVGNRRFGIVLNQMDAENPGVIRLKDQLQSRNIPTFCTAYSAEERKALESVAGGNEI